jgi:hypothetical protein
LPFREGEKMKITFWGIDQNGKDYLYKWKFLLFGLKNALVEFQKVMDQIHIGFGFSICVTLMTSLSVCSSMIEDHGYHL